MSMEFEHSLKLQAHMKYAIIILYPTSGWKNARFFASLYNCFSNPYQYVTLLLLAKLTFRRLYVTLCPDSCKVFFYPDKLLFIDKDTDYLQIIISCSTDSS